MPYVARKYQTANQKRRNRGSTNIPYKYMTRGQKAHSRKGGRRRGGYQKRRRSYY